LYLSNNPSLPQQLQVDSNAAQSSLAEICKYYASQKKATPPAQSTINWWGKNWTDENLVNTISKLSQQERATVTE
jgi:hypothetical protein